MVIHSFDGVLRQPRTMHSFEWPFSRKRVGLPRPVPLVAFIYLAVVELALLLISKVVDFVSVFEAVFSTLSGGDASVAALAACYLIIPAGIVYAAMSAEVDGRAPHLWLISAARFIVRDKHRWCGIRVRGHGDRVRYTGKARFWWDVTAPRLHHGFVRGGRVSTTVPALFTHSFRHRHQVIKPNDGSFLVDSHEVLDLLEVKP